MHASILWAGPPLMVRHMSYLEDTGGHTPTHSSAVGGHSGIPITLHHLKQFFACTAWKSRFMTLSPPALYVNKLNQITRSFLDCFNLYQLQIAHGRWFLLNLSKGCRFRVLSNASWFLWTLFPNMLTSSAWNIPTSLHQWSSFICHMCTSFMACL